MGTDKSLISDFREGNNRSYNAIFAEFFPLLYRYAMRLTRGDRELAQEVVQLAFISLYERRAELELVHGKNSIKLYLLTCVRSKAFREQQRKLKHEILNAPLPEDDKIDAQIAADPDVFNAELISEDLAQLKKQLSELSPTQLKVFELVMVEGMTADEASEHLNLHRRTVLNAKVKVMSALNKFRRPSFSALFYVAFEIIRLLR